MMPDTKPACPLLPCLLRQKLQVSLAVNNVPDKAFDFPWPASASLYDNAALPFDF